MIVLANFIDGAPRAPHGGAYLDVVDPATGSVFASCPDSDATDVAAAVVLRPGVAASDQELRQFAAERLAAFKVPRKILILPEIPVGATGKLQRIGLAKKLGLA